MHYILRKTTINTVEMKAEIADSEDKTDEEIRRELTTLGHLHGWVNPVESHQSILYVMNESPAGTLPTSTRLMTWGDDTE